MPTESRIRSPGTSSGDPAADACVIRVHPKWGLERKHIDRLKAWRAGLGIEQA